MRLLWKRTDAALRPDGQVSRTETGIVNSQSDADWAAMIVLEQVDIGFDPNHHRPVVATHSGGGAIHSVVQTSYDPLGRTDCVAQRMNPAIWINLPASACTPQTPGSHGPDRIGRTVRNAADETTEVHTAIGTALEAAERTATYSSNGRVLTLTDGMTNRTSYEYDGHDRLVRTYLPLAAQSANASNALDYEELGYDAAGNVVTRRNRANQTAAYTVDALGRITLKDLPGAEPDVSYGYDLLGRLTAASHTGHALSFAYDALGRQLTQTGPHGTYASSFDLAGRRTRITHPDGFFVDQDHLVTGEMSAIRENGGLVLASFGYDYLGRRTSLTRGNGLVTSYAYDAASRLTSLAHDFAGTAHDVASGFAYNPAAQIATRTVSNDSFAWTGSTAGTTDSTLNGLNQLSLHGGGTATYDNRGNLVAEGGRALTYDSENRLTAVTTPQNFNLRYDALGRMSALGQPNPVAFFDTLGTDILALRIAAGTINERYVYGPGRDETLVRYQGSGTSDRRYFHADERGSNVAQSDSAATAEGITRYDEYGNFSAYLESGKRSWSSTKRACRSSLTPMPGY